MAWYSGDLLAEGVRIHYVRTGGNKPVVVLAHGYSDNGLCWTPVARALEHDYDLVMYDARGHGLTQTPDEPIDNQVRGADLARVIRGLHLDRPVIMGHSMGAATVAQAAADYPDLMRAAIMEDPPWFAAAPTGEARATLQDRMAAMQAMKEKGRDGLIAQCRVDSPTWPEAELVPWADAKLQFQVDTLALYTGSFENWQDIAKRIVCPALMVIADADKGALVTLDVAAQALRVVPQLQVVQVQGAGHNIRREGFDKYMAAVKEFLRTVYQED